MVDKHDSAQVMSTLPRPGRSRHPEQLTSIAPVEVAARAGAEATRGYVVFGITHGLQDTDLPVGYRLKGITTGYRQGGTYWQCLLTLFTAHNQTLNSWTMVLGVVASSWLLWWVCTNLHPTGWDLAAFVAIWLCPAVHLPFTVGYHQFLSMGPEMLRRWRAYDVAYIFIASIPLTFGLAYYVMPLPYCLGLTGLTLGLSLHAWHNAASLPAGAEINKQANTKYVGLVVLTYTFPIMLQATLDALSYASGQHFARYWLADVRQDSEAIRTAAAEGAEVYDPLYTVRLVAYVAFCFCYAGAVYIAGYPEAWAPGVFDIVGSAQQLMHLGIVGANVLEWLFAIHMFCRKYGLPTP